MKPKIQEVRHLSFVSVIMMILSVSVFCSEVVAATYYISPSGSDANPGTSGSPYKTFAYAMAAARFVAGDTLILKDGRYGDANGNGYPDINCSSGYNNGTAGSRITIQAENERLAFLDRDGADDVFKIRNCSYWTIKGLRFRSADKTPSTTSGGVASVINSNFIEFKRNLFSNDNRYQNQRLLAYLDNSNDGLIEENEFYSFHRHGYGSASNGSTYPNRLVARRNYANSRAHADIAGGFPSGSTTKGDTAFILYPCNDCIGENNISEGNNTAIDIEASVTGSGRRNKFYGNISLLDDAAVRMTARATTANDMPQDNEYHNSVVINSKSVAVYSRASKNTIINGMTVRGATGMGGVVADDGGSGFAGDHIYSINWKNILIHNIAGYGLLANSVGDTWSGTVNKINSSSNAANDFNGGITVTNSTTTDPAMGSCYAWIPSTSPMKGAGEAGVDIGANILYQYQNGTLTSTPLWNSDGSFPHGAVVPGVNDAAGASAFDVHWRLNVNTNGCSFPAGYGSVTVTSAPAPSGLRIVQ